VIYYIAIPLSSTVPGTPLPMPGNVVIKVLKSTYGLINILFMMSMYIYFK